MLAAEELVRQDPRYFGKVRSYHQRARESREKKLRRAK